MVFLKYGNNKKFGVLEHGNAYIYDRMREKWALSFDDQQDMPI
jgi:hypothetical protein